MAESATLGGSDVFRALERLPGVTQYDDWSAKLWVRGNRWDQSRVYYDGLPLFDPLQVLGRGAGVSSDAIGAAYLHPGVRPVSLGGEGAARIDLQSRPAGGEGEWRGSSDVSTFGLGAVVEREREDESGGFVVSARHSLGTLFGAHTLSDIDGRLVNDVQVATRGDQTFASGRRLETSALLTRDGERSGVTGARESQHWGNAAARVTLVQPLGALVLSNTVAATRFSSSRQQALAFLANDPAVIDSVAFRPVTSSVDYAMLSGRLTPAARGLDGWATGYDLVAQQSSFSGLRMHLLWGDASTDRLAHRDALSYASLWADRRTTVGERFSVEAGLRTDVGGAGLNGMRPAPTLQARYLLGDRTSIAAGAGRVHQYVQSIDLPVVAQGRTAPGLWLTSGGDVPMMAVDNAMIGVERWTNGAVLLAANAYARHTSGAIIADPTPGALVNRRQFVGSTEQARGVEVSARKLAGRVTGMVAYSYGHAVTTSEGLNFPSSADRTHALDATSMLRLGGFRIGSGFSWTSGAPYTRTFFGTLSSSAGTMQVGTPASRELPNALRAPTYASLDVFADYTRTIRSVGVSVFGGVQNMTGRTNRSWFVASGYCAGQFVAAACPDNDLFEAPVKDQPTFGLRLWF